MLGFGKGWVRVSSLRQSFKKIVGKVACKLLPADDDKWEKGKK